MVLCARMLFYGNGVQHFTFCVSALLPMGIACPLPALRVNEPLNPLTSMSRAMATGTPMNQSMPIIMKSAPVATAPGVLGVSGLG